MKVERGEAGVLLVDKPEGPSSHDVVKAARRNLGQRRIGHTGTLDPFASGLLLLCLGWCTRLAEYLLGLPKRYTATAVLGSATDTDDRTGAVLTRSEAWRTLTASVVEAALQSRRGAMLQRPPAYSAKKIQGERAYRRARRGEIVSPDPVPVEIMDISLRRLDLPRVEFDVLCSAGTYVRALARDVGEILGTGAYLERLRRTDIGSFQVVDAVDADLLSDPTAVGPALRSPLEALVHMPHIELIGAPAHRLVQGQSIALDDPGRTGDPTAEVVAAVSGGVLLAVAQRSGNVLRPRKVFVHA
jgi:tRNA pseudouridine55 synthase